MTFCEFMLALGFWQWVGILCLAGIAGECIVGIVRAIRRRKP